MTAGLSLWRYRERLPVEPLVTLDEGWTPLVRAPRLSERDRRRRLAEDRGRQPDRLVQGPRHDGGRVGGDRPRAPRRSSARRPATPPRAPPPTRARAGLRGAVIVPEGKIATGKLAQALMHGARVVALRGNFDQALTLVRELARAAPDRARQLGQRVPRRGAEDRRRSRSATSSARRPTCSASRSATRATSPPGGAASRSTRSRRGMFGFQAEGAAPLVHGAPVENPETVASAIRIGNPARWEEAMDAVTVVARRDPRGVRRRDPRRLRVPRRERGRLLRAGVGRVGGRAAQVRRRGHASCACSPATG